MFQLIVKMKVKINMLKTFVSMIFENVPKNFKHKP